MEQPADEYGFRWESIDSQCYADLMSQFGSGVGQSPMDRVQIGCVVGNREDAVRKVLEWVGRFSRQAANAVHSTDPGGTEWDEVFKLDEQHGPRAAEVRILKEREAWAAVIVLHDRYPVTYVY